MLTARRVISSEPVQPTANGRKKAVEAICFTEDVAVRFQKHAMSSVGRLPRPLRYKPDIERPDGAKKKPRTIRNDNHTFETTNVRYARIPNNVPGPDVCIWANVEQRSSR